MVPWSELCDLVEPFYPKGEAGRRPFGLERMLRIYCLQQWFNLSDPAAEEALYDSLSMRRFAGIDLGREPVPGETTICRFRHLLKAHDFGRRMFERVHEYLQAKGLRLSSGTIVDATIIHAPSSTKNEEKAPKARDRTNRRYRHRGVVNEAERARNRENSRVRSRVEHVIGVIKLKFGFTKVRYRGLEKNANRLFATCRLTNLYILRHRFRTA